MKRIIKVSLPEVKFRAKGMRIGMSTMVGADTSSYPVKHGNCFSMVADNGQTYKIVNFVYENLEKLILDGLQMPVDLVVLQNDRAAIHDARIKDDWYPKEFCVVCCPRDDLPTPQRLKIGREEDSGKSVTWQAGDSVFISSQ